MASQMCVEKKNMSLFIISQTQSEKIVQWLQCVLFKDVYTACRHLHITFIQIWRGHAYLNNEISLFFLIYVASVWTNVSPFLNVSLNSQKCFDIKSAHYKSKSFHWLIFGPVSSNQEQKSQGENASALVLSRVFVSKSVFTEKRKNIDLLGLAEIKVIFKVLVKGKRFSLQPSEFFVVVLFEK